MVLLKCVLNFLLLQTVLGLYVPKKTSTKFKAINGDTGEPLFLTSLLEDGKHKEARKLSYVQPRIGNVTSYSGYFTVNKKCESNLFFWFFPAEKENWEELPLLLWLQGGPGYTSMFGLFEEIGPFLIDEFGPRKRQYSWTTERNVIFIDQPVGTGFSFTGRDCYAENENDVGRDLYQAVVQFHLLFPVFQKNDFYIGGESYAGHYIPALGHAIHKNKQSAKVNINLAAMMIGNGFFDNVGQIEYSSYLYQLGLIDDKGKNEFEKLEDDFVDLIEDENYIWASVKRAMIEGVLYVDTVGKNVSMYNYLEQSSPENMIWEEFINTPEIRRALKVGDNSFERASFEVIKHLFEDMSISVKPWVEELLEFYPIIFYNGQLDIICGYPMMITFLRSLQWSDQHQYLDATRSKWCVGEEQAGYFKGEHHLYDVLVRGAGHMVPTDKPHWAYELVNSVTSGSPDNPLHALKTCD